MLQLGLKAGALEAESSDLFSDDRLGKDMCCLRELSVELQLVRELLALREVAFEAFDSQRKDGGVVVRNAVVVCCRPIERLTDDVLVLLEDLSLRERQLVQVAVDAEE